MNCPYCLAEIDNPDSAVACRSCGARYHLECWTENGGCCAKGCESAVRGIEIEMTTPADVKLSISREEAERAVSHTARRASNPCMKCGRQVPEGDLYCLECAPGSPENEDARNVGPILLMLALIVLAVGWILVFALFPGDVKHRPEPVKMENKLTR